MIPINQKSQILTVSYLCLSLPGWVRLGLSLTIIKIMKHSPFFSITNIMFDVLDMDMKWILSNPYHKVSLHLLAKAKKETFSHQLLVIIMPKNSLTKWEIAKTIAPSVVTMVILPIVDVSTDITVVCNLYMHAHWHFATILLGQY